MGLSAHRTRTGLRSDYWKRRHIKTSPEDFGTWAWRMRNRGKNAWRGRIGANRQQVGLFSLPKRYTKQGAKAYLAKKREKRLGGGKLRSKNAADYFKFYSPSASFRTHVR
jgi:hypothetical protein